MSLNDVYRNRHYGSGYVYIAGSRAARLLKIGTTVNIYHQQAKLRRLKYGRVDDWILLYYVWVNEGGKTEHDTRRKLRRYQILRNYEKDGRTQRGRELVQCDFSVALAALVEVTGSRETSNIWQSNRCHLFDFDRMDEIQREAEARQALAAKTPFDFVLLTKVDEFPLSVRSANCLRNDSIVYVGDLVRRTEAEMLRTPNFGRKSLNEIKEALAKVGLHFGMEIEGWPPADFESTSKLLGTVFTAKVDELELSVRAAVCLRNDRIVHIGDLVQRTEADMLRTPNFGQKSLNEIKEALARLGLHFGMEVPGWPTGNEK